MEVADKEINYERLLRKLKSHEGFRQFPYKCPAGYLTIGYGRNLETKGITREEAEILLLNDVKEVEKQLRQKLPFFNKLSSVRKEVLINMAFNLGINGLMKFKRMLHELEHEDYDKASEEMKDSKWYHQVKNRAKELVYAMKYNKYPY